MRSRGSGRRGVVAAAVATVLGSFTSAAGAPQAVAAPSPDGPSATTLRAEFAASDARLADQPGTGALAFVGATVADPLTAPSADAPATVARRFVDSNAMAFGVTGRELVAERVVDDTAGRAVRFQQRHRGIEVIGAELTVQLAADGAVLSTTAHTAAKLDVDVTPAVAADTAAATALAYTAKTDGVDAAALSAAPPELAVFDPNLWGITDGAGARLVWRTEVRTAIGDVNRYVLIDAERGSIAHDFEQVHAGRQRSVCDRLGQPPGPPPCTAPVRTEGGPASPVADVNDAYDFAGQTYDFYLNVLGRDSLDGNGLPLRSTVRICFSNECPYQNAFWDGDTEQMYYGAGFTRADDVVGHELTHGVTAFTSGLLYYGQSGAINESLSDVFGELIDRSTPDAGAAWAVGEDLLGIGPIRSMSDPTAFGDPDRVRSPFYLITDDDSGGVHINSGVNNKAASLIADGGTFNGQTVIGLGDEKTAWIYYTAQTTMLASLSQYSDLANMLPQACTNLVGQHGFVTADCDQVTAAVTATEMALSPQSGLLTPVAVCPTSGEIPNRVAFADTQADDTAWQLSTTAPSATPTFELGTAGGDRKLFLPEASVTAAVTAQTTQAFTVPAGETYLMMRHLWGTESTWDGGVVEYSTNGTTWTDLQQAVGSGNVVHGYNDISRTSGVGNTSPLAGRAQFGGNSVGYVFTRYTLASLAGQTIRLRFRVGSDSSFAELGWVIDDLGVYACGSVLVPQAPSPVTAAAADGQVTVSWPTPFDGGDPLLDYTVTPVESGTPLTPRVLAIGVNTTTFTGLTNGTSYRFTVSARNAIGEGDVATSNTVVPGTLPGVPGTPMAVRGNGAATLTWTAPAGSAPVTGYSIVPARDGVPQTAVAVGPATSTTITGLTNGSTYTFTVAAVNAVGTGQPSAPSNAVVLFGPFTPLQPARLLETRSGLATVDGQFNGIGLRAAGSVTAVQVVGRAGVPFDASAVSLNVTVTDARDAGYVTVFPCGVGTPDASNLNYATGSTVPNLVVAKVGLGGLVCIFTRAPVHLIVDVGGYFPSGAALTSLVPARLLETRPGLSTVDNLANGIGRRAAGSVTEVQVTGRGGVPGTAVAVVLNVTVTGTQAPGYATVYPCGSDVPAASNLNYGTGVTVPNATITKVGTGGKVCIFTLAATDLLVDVNGWFPDGADLVPLVPARLLETRPGLQTIDGLFNGIGTLTPGTVTTLHVGGRAGVPNDATAVALNVTVTNTQAPGFVTVYPCQATPPTASNLNFGVGVTVANAVLTKVDAAGNVCIYSQATYDLVVDVNGSVTG